VPFASDEHPVCAPDPCRPHEPLSDRVHTRRLRRGRHHFDPTGSEDRVERGRELESRSLIRWVNFFPVSDRSAVSSRASWVAQAAVGNRVTPSR
jgi:hypothetical protein